MTVNPVGDYPRNNWTPPKTTKKVTETFEYDAQGRVIKKTVVTEEIPQCLSPYTQPHITY